MTSLDFYTSVLQTMINKNVRFLVVGGYAVNSYGFMRSTGDMDIWIDTDELNLEKLRDVLVVLKYKNEAVKTAISELKNNKNINLVEDEFFKIEIISLLSSTLSFNEAYERKEFKSLLKLPVPMVCLEDLINLKIKSGRDKDLLDVRELKRLRNEK